jgi:hypothetical protein
MSTGEKKSKRYCVSIDVKIRDGDNWRLCHDEGPDLGARDTPSKTTQLERQINVDSRRILWRNLHPVTRPLARLHISL